MVAPLSEYEAAVIANLHTQATGVQNICSLVPVILDPTWCDLVLLTLQHYTLNAHVLTNTAFLTIPPGGE